MKFTGKKMAFVMWAIAVVLLINAILNISSGTVWFITQLVSIVLHCIIAFAMFREKNDRFTKIIVILFALTSFNISVAIIIALMLCKKYVTKLKFISKLWFIPAISSVVIYAITFPRSYAALYCSYSTGKLIFTISILILNVVTDLILGYWLIKDLDIIVKNRTDIPGIIDSYGDITASSNNVIVEYKGNRTGSGQKTTIGIISGAIVFIIIIISIVLSIKSDLALFDLLF